MWHMRRINVFNTFATKLNNFTISEGYGRPAGEVINRNIAPHLTVCELRVGCMFQPIIHSAAFVCFNMAETDPFQPIQRNDPSDSDADMRK